MSIHLCGILLMVIVRSDKMKKYIDLIRVKHWVKNLLIFIPLVCAKKITGENVLIVMAGFFTFSFASSFVYIINDIKDIEKDKLHPRKKNRPLPSGKISKKSALIIALVFLILSILINLLISKDLLTLSLYLLLSYIMINIMYSFGFKKIAILDIVLLAAGFVLRVYYGAAIINIEVSNWLFLTVLNASLFMGLGKRKKELTYYKESRKVLDAYNESFLDKFGTLSLTLTIVFYSLWAMEQNINALVFTVPLLMIIFMRYSLVVDNGDEGDPVTVFYNDKMLLALCVIYIILIAFLLVI